LGIPGYSTLSCQLILRCLICMQIVDATYRENKRHYALKILNKAQLIKKKVIRSAMVEKEALIALGTREQRHQGIVRLHHCFQDHAHLCESSLMYLDRPLIVRLYPGFGLKWRSEGSCTEIWFYIVKLRQILHSPAYRCSPIPS